MTDRVKESETNWGYPENVMDRIALRRGWLPLSPGAQMEVGLDGKRWVVQRVASPDDETEVTDAQKESIPSSRQVGGTHYQGMAIQPAEFTVRNGLGHMEGDAIAYLCRWRQKGGVEDLRKAIHSIELLIQYSEAGQ